MSRTRLTPQTFTSTPGAASVTWTAADQANGMVFANDGDTILMVRNTDASSHTCTIASVADHFGRIGDITMTAAAESGVNDGISVSSRLPAHLFNQPGTSDVNIDFTSGTGVMVAAVQIPPRR